MTTPTPFESAPTDAERHLALAAHVLTFAGNLVPILGMVGGPLILWLVKKDESPFVDDHGRQAINFGISMVLWYVLGGILFFVGIGACILAILPILHVVAVVFACVHAIDGQVHRYPVTLPIL